MTHRLKKTSTPYENGSLWNAVNAGIEWGFAIMSEGAVRETVRIHLLVADDTLFVGAHDCLFIGGKFGYGRHT